MIFQEDLFPCFSKIMRSKEKYSPFQVDFWCQHFTEFLTTDKIMRLLSIEKPLPEHRSWSLLGELLPLVTSIFPPALTFFCGL